MKMCILPLLFLISVHTFSQQSGWYWINPLPQGNNLLASTNSGLNTAYSVGDRGAVLKTTDKGLNWTYTEAKIYKNFSGTYFINDNTGYAVGGFNGVVIAKTTNGGINWIELSPGVNAWLRGVYFFDINTGLTCGDNGIVLKTTDEGNTWNIKNSGVSNTLFNISSVGASVCFISAGNSVLRTTDRGEVWNTIPMTDTSSVVNLYFLNANTGFGLCNDRAGKIIKSTNSGANWSRYYLPTTANLTSTSFSFPLVFER